MINVNGCHLKGNDSDQKVVASLLQRGLFSLEANYFPQEKTILRSIKKSKQWQHWWVDCLRV